MKKIFTLLAVCVFAMAAQAQIHIRVQCETAPFIWSWGAADGVDYNVGAWPGTNQFKEEWPDPETGDVFWEWTFPEGVYPISFLFNNGGVDAEGNPIAVKQTGDINSVKTDRYFILDWNAEEVLVDITEQYIELPDAEVNTVSLAGNNNDWAGDVDWFTVVEAGKKFSMTVDASAADFAPDALWEFKFRPNAQEWVGYWDVYYDDENNPDPEDGRAPKSTAPEWLSENGGNFLIDLEADEREVKTYTITVTWGGGKEAGKNWAFEISGPTSGISNIKALNAASNAPIYNLQGQRVNDSFRGIAIQNGRKFVVK